VIYAIRAVGTRFVKIGRAKSVGRRLKELDTGCPHELHIEAVADWPDGQESAIHAYLDAHCEKFEWFRDSEKTAKVIEWLQAGEEGLRRFRVTFLAYAEAKAMPRWTRALQQEYEYPSGKQPRRKPKVEGEPPSLADLTAEELRLANERYESIKLRALERRGTISPTQEPRPQDSP
jgi:hypothetical protein